MTEPAPGRLRGLDGNRMSKSVGNTILLADSAEAITAKVRSAYEKAIAELKDTLNKDSAKWTWGALHTASYENGTLGKSGVFLIEDLFNRGPFATSGGKSIVNATNWNPNLGYEVTNVPSMRQIVDMSNLNNSITVHTTGQSGHAYNKHYDDMSKLWASIQYYPMWWEQDSVITDSEGHLQLVP